VSLFEVGPGQVELVVGGAAGAPQTSVRLFGRVREDEYHVVFGVEVVDDGLRARVENVEVTVWDPLEEFFDGLARDFRGWEGERVWTNNHLVVSAGFGRGGHVCVSWTLRADVFDHGWESTVSTVIEGGEEMARVASEVRDFVCQGDSISRSGEGTLPR
jgi:hypothetical protein